MRGPRGGIAARRELAIVRRMTAAVDKETRPFYSRMFGGSGGKGEKDRQKNLPSVEPALKVQRKGE